MSRGFTLIELLVASVMMALISAGVAASLSAGLGAWRHGVAGTREEGPRLVLGRMLGELRGIAADGQRHAFITSTDGEGGGIPADTLLMSCSNPQRQAELWRGLLAADRGEEEAWAPIPARTQVEYALDMGEEPGLYRREVAPADQEPVEEGDWEPICPRVVGLDIAWYDGTQWVEQWDTQTQSELTLPRAVLVTLYLEDETGRQRTFSGETTILPGFDDNEQAQGQ